jgi:hypothetical protein
MSNTHFQFFDDIAAGRPFRIFAPDSINSG